ncbi:MAG: YkgJ family cysteine cluster protein [Acidobacteriota bacterium]|nr:YkgJ family cysteine cluster protein [Acidobacteriota bacterium]MDP2389582.1 YkgJ family cysteine cluster protein [Acidobacteriota bacterium]
MRTSWLNFHVTYACRHSGACCSSGWAIPVERDRVIPIRGLAGRPDDSWLVPEPDAPGEVAGMLALQANGHCVFHGAGGCGVHSARPVSCAHFPYVCLIDQRGVHVTLSHYCPAAASLLFTHEGPIEIVDGPSPVAGFDIPEGLDARESLPPLEAPERLMTFDAFAAWERSEVRKAPTTPSMAVAIALFEHARFAVPAPWSWDEAPSDVEQQWEARVAPAWPGFAPVVQRYRAAKVFASWAAYTADGLEAVLRVADIADAVLRIEAVRQCITADRPLDAELLKQAIRQSDLLIVHYADGWVLSSGTAP